MATAIVAPVAAHSGICESSSDQVTLRNASNLESLSSSGICEPSSSLISSLLRRRFCGAAVAAASALVALVAAAPVALPPLAAVAAAWRWLWMAPGRQRGRLLGAPGNAESANGGLGLAIVI